MGSILYFIETAGNAPNETRLGLIPEYVGGGLSYACNAGPGGARGVIYAGREVRTARAVFDASRQRWVPGPTVPEGRTWVGCWLDQPPAPEALETPRSQWVREQFQYRLEDGNVYTFPRLSYGATTALPQAISLGDNGQLIREPLAEFEELSRDGVRFWRFLSAAWRLTERQADDPVLGDAEILGLCIRALGVHYRIGPAEARLLGLFSDRNVPDIAALLVGIDLARIDAAALNEKKAHSDSRSGGSGVGESCRGDACPTTGLSGQSAGGEQ